MPDDCASRILGFGWLEPARLPIDPSEWEAAARLQRAIDATLAAWDRLPLNAIAIDAHPHGADVTLLLRPDPLSAHESMRATALRDDFSAELHAILAHHPDFFHPAGISRMTWAPGKPTTIEYAGTPKRTNAFDLRGGRTVTDCLPIGAAMKRARISTPKGSSRSRKPRWSIGLRSGTYDTDIHYAAGFHDAKTAARHLLGLTAIQLALGDAGRIVIRNFGPDTPPPGGLHGCPHGPAGAIRMLRHRPNALDRLILSLLDPQHLAA